MAKSNSHPQLQGAFSFFDDAKETEIPSQPTKKTLLPPTQIMAEDIINDSNTTIENISPLKSALVSHVSAEPMNDATEPMITEPPPKQGAKAPLPQEEHTFVGKKSTRGRKPVKAHAAASLVELPDDEVLFSKMYYSMGEVTTMLNESHSLIRYWENEFDLLKPKKNGKGDRFFRPTDVKNLYLIYDLLRRQKYTIEGAREYLKNNKSAKEKFEMIQSLEKIKSFFLELKAAL